MILEDASVILSLIGQSEISPDEFLLLRKYTTKLIRELKLIRNRSEGLSELAKAAYGIHNNPYANIELIVDEIIVDLENNMFGSKKAKSKPTSNVNTDNWAFTRLRDLTNRASMCSTLFTSANDRKEEIIKLAFNVKKNKHYQLSACGEIIFFLNVDNLLETRYEFTQWQYKVSVTVREKTDGEHWPILKDLYPEEYI